MRKESTHSASSSQGGGYPMATGHEARGGSRGRSPEARGCDDESLVDESVRSS